MSTHWLSKRTALDSATFVEDEGYTVVVTDMVRAWSEVEPRKTFMKAGDLCPRMETNTFYGCSVASTRIIANSLLTSVFRAV